MNTNLLRETTDNVIEYDPQLKIVNLDALPRGLGRRFLEVIRSPDNAVLIAKAWRSKPKRGTWVIDFQTPSGLARKIRAIPHDTKAG